MALSSRNFVVSNFKLLARYFFALFENFVLVKSTHTFLSVPIFSISFGPYVQFMKQCSTFFHGLAVYLLHAICAW